MNPVQTVTQGLEFWVEIYHAEEEATQGITVAYMIDSLEEFRNVVVQQIPPIPISDIEADCAKECDLVDKEYVTTGGHIVV